VSASRATPAQERVAQPLGLGANLRALRFLAELGTLDGEGHLVRERLELMQLLGPLDGSRLRRAHPQHTDRPP
jgi:hypothetical protein